MLRALAALLALAGPAAAEPWFDVADGRARATVLPGWVEADGSRMAALAIELAPGWYTYWRVPGATGVPPQFDWSASENLADVRYEWPRPEVFASYGTRVYGYHDELVLPLVLVPAAAGEPIELALDLLLGICQDICIPAQVRIETELAPDMPASGRARIEAARAHRPLDPAEAGIVATNCAIRPGAEGMELTATLRFRAPPRDPQAVVIEASDPAIRIGEADIRIEGTALTAEARLDWFGPGEMLLDRSRLRVTLLDATRAVEIRGCSASG